MNILQIAKLSGGIEKHIAGIQKHSRHKFFFLDYKKVHAVPIPILRALTFVKFGTIAGLLEIRKNKIDIIHAHYILPAGFLGLQLSKLTGKPLVLTIHGSDIVRLPILNFLKKFILKNATVITTSRYLQKEVEKLGSKSTLIPNGLDHQKIAAAKPIHLNHPALLFIGALTKNKVAFLPQIAKSIHSLPCNLYAIGDGPLKGKFKADFLGNLSHEKTYSYLKSADIFASTSEWEGFGLSILEAMACRIPVVARPNSAVSELISGGRGIPANTPAQFLCAIQKLLKDKNLRKELSTKSHNFSKNFSWKKSAEQTDNVYRGLQKGR